MNLFFVFTLGSLSDRSFHLSSWLLSRCFYVMVRVFFLLNDLAYGYKMTRGDAVIDFPLTVMGTSFAEILTSLF